MTTKTTHKILPRLELLHLRKRELEKFLAGPFDPAVSLELDAVLTAIEARADERRDWEAGHGC